jgi:osmotically-inducible protein OsmY
MARKGKVATKPKRQSKATAKSKRKAPKASVKKAGHALRQSAMDRELKRKIEEHLPHSDHSQVSVSVKAGFVVLRGFVRSFRERERLRRFVLRLVGVRALKDLMRIKPAETLADREVALHVRNALDAHSELPPGTATVHVSNGTCALRGYVCSAEERHVAEMVARNCRGVRTVVNELAVDPLDEEPDAATTRLVRKALDYCKDFDTQGITVSCMDGRVVLRGRVPTLLDRLLAEEITRIQSCVRSVENHIQVVH